MEYHAVALDTPDGTHLGDFTSPDKPEKLTLEVRITEEEQSSTIR